MKKQSKSIVAIVAHPDDAEIWAGGTLLLYKQLGYIIHIVYPIPTCPERFAETNESPFIHTQSENLKKLLVEISPEIIFTHWGLDFHTDHRKVSEMLLELIPDLIVFHELNFNLYFLGTYNNIGLSQNKPFVPTDMIDISSFFSEKIKLISKYTSQDPSIWKDMITPINRVWGNSVGICYAEGFISVPILGRSNLLRNRL